MNAYPEADRMKVLHIVGDSRYGGIARIILGLGRMAREDGWQVDVLATDPEVQDALRSESLGIVNLDVIRRRVQPFWDLAGLFRLYGFLRRERYGIVHTHTSKGGFVGRLAAWMSGAPIVVHTVHGFAFHEQSPALVRMVYSGMERMAARWCHQIVSVSEFHQRWALELGICPPPRMKAIPNGIQPAPRSDDFESAALRRSLGVNDGEILVLSTARLAPDKGLRYLIEAAAILARGRQKYRILIAGDGPSRAHLQNLVRDHGVSSSVAFLGFRQDVGNLLAASDLVVLPSLREGLSIALLEAMAAGKPIIATSIGSHRELAEQADMARLVPPADPAALAEAIQQFTHDPPLMAHLAATAHSLFQARYTEERMLREYRELYWSLVGGDSRPPGTAAGPESVSVVRSATAKDVAGIVKIHQSAFRRFFLTKMGAAFLRQYYELVLQYRAGIVLVSEKHGVINGFVCGFAEPAEFYRLMLRKGRSFGLPALLTVLRHPTLAAKVLQSVRRIQTSAAQGPPHSCELSSIAVAPEAAGNGVGRALLRSFLNHSWSRNAECVYLTTDADANEPANALYREAGFRHSRRFLQRKDRWMNEYVLHRAPAAVPMETHS